MGREERLVPPAGVRSTRGKEVNMDLTNGIEGWQGLVGLLLGVIFLTIALLLIYSTKHF